MINKLTDKGKIVKKYIDFETRLLVVELIKNNSNSIHFVTINSRSGELIPVEERSGFIDYSEKEIPAKRHNCNIVICREVNNSTGAEFFVPNGEIMLSKKSIAFSSKRHEGIEADFNEAELLKEREESFWLNEYNNYSRSKKIEYWLSNIHHGMRIQGEATGDKYSEFSKAWYNYVKSREPDFDSIFIAVTRQLGFDFDWNEYEKRKRV
ncbi:MAG TPA: hypothetical protein VIM75_16245 [Ohtaekwangia sp.]|uniref:hypothetical protein n=1 Tax=Ohtaekwangia sp. TaxID=2066019 RepID=UPI002F939523